MKALAIVFIVSWLLVITAFSAAETDNVHFQDGSSEGTFSIHKVSPEVYHFCGRELTKFTITIHETTRLPDPLEDFNYTFIIEPLANNDYPYLDATSGEIKKLGPIDRYPCEISNDTPQIIECSIQPQWIYSGHYEFAITSELLINFPLVNYAKDTELWKITVIEPHIGGEGDIITHELEFVRYPGKISAVILFPHPGTTISEEISFISSFLPTQCAAQYLTETIYYKKEGQSEWTLLGEPESQDIASYIYEESEYIAEIQGFVYDLDPTELENGNYDLKFTVCSGPSEEWQMCSNELLFPITIDVQLDYSEPSISDETPEDESIVDELRPEISVIAKDDDSGIDESSIIVEIDGREDLYDELVFDESSGKISVTPNTDLEQGKKHYVSVKLKNNEGLSYGGGEGYGWEFSIAGEDEPLPNEGPPTATLYANPKSGEGPIKVNFICKCNQGTSLLESCKLEFGDGNYTQFGEQGSTKISGNQEHFYPQRDTPYVAVLTAKDIRGLESKNEVMIHSLPPINEAPEIDSFIATPQFSDLEDPVTVNEGEGIEFIVEANDPNEDNLTYTWDFGDGESVISNENYVYYSYYFEKGETEKTYHPKVTVSDGELEISKTIKVIVEKALMKITVSVLSPQSIPITKGNPVNVKVEITDDSDELMEAKDINSYFNDPSNVFSLNFNQAGIHYTGNIDSSIKTKNTGYIFIVAAGDIGLEKEIAGTVYTVNFSPADFVKKISTTPSIPAIGSILENITIRLDYPDETPVNNATLIGRIEGSDLGNILFEETASGIYEAVVNYEVKPRDSGGITLHLKAFDEFGNGSEEFYEEIIGTNPLNPLLNAIVAIIAVIFIVSIGIYLYRQRTKDKKRLKGSLVKEKSSLGKKLHKVKYQYHKRIISEGEYKEKVLQIEQKLATVEDMLGGEKTTKVSLSKGEINRQKQVLMNRLKAAKEKEAKKYKLGENYSEKKEPAIKSEKKPEKEIEHKLVTVEGKKKLYIPPGELEEIDRELMGTGNLEEGKEGIAAKTHSILSGILKRETLSASDKKAEPKFSESERKEIKKLILLLHGKKAKFSRDEVKKSITDEGYSQRIAEKVVSILFKDK